MIRIIDRFESIINAALLIMMAVVVLLKTVDLGWTIVKDIAAPPVFLYPELIAQRVAMKIGDHYDIWRIGIADWRTLARACTIDEERVLTMLTDMAKVLPDEISAAREQALIEGPSERIIAPLAQQLISHVGERLATITAVTSSRSPTVNKARRGGWS